MVYSYPRYKGNMLKDVLIYSKRMQFYSSLLAVMFRTWLANISSVDASLPRCSWWSLAFLVQKANRMLCWLISFFTKTKVMSDRYGFLEGDCMKYCPPKKNWNGLSMTFIVHDDVFHQTALGTILWEPKIVLRWIIPILFCSAQLLILLGQNTEVAQLAAAYNRTTAPALFCLFQYQVRMLGNGGFFQYVGNCWCCHTDDQQF